MRVIHLLIGGMVVLVLALVAVLFLVILPGESDGGNGGGSSKLFASDGVGGAVDSEARIELELLRGDIENLQIAIANLEGQLNELRSAQTDNSGILDGAEEIFNNGENDIIDSYAQVVLVADRRNINQGLFVASPKYLIEKLGMPRPDLNDNCQAMTNPRLKNILVTEQVGPIRVSMLKPAADSLARVFENIRKADPDLYDRINTAGSLCVRRIRGSKNSVSTHSFGLAVDLNIDGRLDTLGDGKTQLGLTILADFFNTEGWVWGAAFSREDSMHFEVSKKQLDEWIAQGLL
ncbi:M15 family metallopeptidase [Frigidibacter sp. ROC022]|uniref:M15 family metallopeptidase n=1 Tax=Frigidibacter sp. ROC022 TaxID=2971796 RepID=UPI00215AB89F|nr:M15 family metallopeptidase [Frigidibacter sp. ROC022]MCR8723345.1 M15 family metallopeptidase [Frigidibacter sp. ROC022]